MKLEMQVTPEHGMDHAFSKQVELPYLPPKGMDMTLGGYEGNAVVGVVTRHHHDLENDITSFTVVIEFPPWNGKDLPEEFFSQENGWRNDL